MIIKDIIESHSVRRTAAGYGVDRIFVISDVTGSADARLYNAIQNASLPQYGDPHPVIPEIQVTDIQASPVSGESENVKIRVTYSIPSSDDSAEGSEGGTGRAVITSSLTNEQTHFDINGDLIKASYTSALNAISTTYAPVDVQRPQMRVTLTRRESEIPKENLKKFLGRVNSVAWSGFPPITWLCSGISVREIDGAFDVDYSFEYREERWKGELVLPIDAADAQDSPIDKDTGNGFALFDVYHAANFNELGLSF